MLDCLHMKKGFCENIEEKTIANQDFRHVLYTGENSQLVLMTLQPNEDIGMEIHEENDQFFRIEKGVGQVIINETTYEVSDDFAVIVPAGAEHNVINTSASETMHIYTIYMPPHHADGTIRKTKAEAMADEPEYDGTTTE